MIIQPTSTLAIGSSIGGASTGLLKTTSGLLAAAVAGTDYLAPTGNGSALTGITESQVSGLVADLAARPQSAASATISGAWLFTAATVPFTGQVLVGASVAGSAAAQLEVTAATSSTNIFAGYTSVGGNPFLVDPAGHCTATTLKATQTLAWGTGGTPGVGAIYSDSNWGILLQGNTSSPAIARFALLDGAGATLLRIAPTNLMGVFLNNALAPLSVKGTIAFQDDDSTTAEQLQSFVEPYWADSTHATRRGGIQLWAQDATSQRLGFTVVSDGSQALCLTRGPLYVNASSAGSAAAQLEVTAATSSTNILAGYTSTRGLGFVFLPDGSLRLPSLADASAANNSIYYSTTQSKLCYKDSGGTVNPLY